MSTPRKHTSLEPPRTEGDQIAVLRSMLATESVRGDRLEHELATERTKREAVEKRVKAIEISLFGLNAPTEEQLDEDAQGYAEAEAEIVDPRDPDDEDAAPIGDSDVDEGPHEDD